MESVWIVMYGQLREIEIEAIFASEAEAKAFANGCEGVPDSHIAEVWIEKWDLGAAGKDMFQKMWRACIDWETGKVDFTEFLYRRHPSGWSCASGRAAESCVSEDHAIELARESRKAILKKERGQ